MELMDWTMESKMSSRHSTTEGSTCEGPSKVSRDTGLEMADTIKYLVVCATVRKESLSRDRLEVVLRTDPFKRSESADTARQLRATLESPKISKLTIL